VTVERTIGSGGNDTESNSAKNRDGEEFEEHLNGKESKTSRYKMDIQMEVDCKDNYRPVGEEMNEKRNSTCWL